MKGKVNLYFAAENIGKVRSRIDNPSKEFSSEIRQMIQESIQDVVNEHILAIRAKMIAKFQAKGYPIKDPKHAVALASTLQPFFDVVVSLQPFASDSDTDAPTAGEPDEAKAEPANADTESDEFEE